MKQGDFLSLYLFVLCMEVLGHMITEEVMSCWRPIIPTRGSSIISHLSFTNDLLFFAKAFPSQSRVIQGVVARFCEISGQKVNISKSKIFMSSNTEAGLRHPLCSMEGLIGVHMVS